MEKNKQQPGFMVYWDVLDVILKLPDKKIKPMLEAIRDYCLRGQVPEFRGTSDLVWPIIRSRLDVDRDRYQDVRQRNRLKGLVSSFRRVYAPAHELSPEDPQALSEYLQQHQVAAEDILKLTGVNCGQPDQPAIDTTTATDTKTETDTETDINTKTKININTGAVTATAVKTDTVTAADTDAVSAADSWSGPIRITEQQKQKALKAYLPLLRADPGQRSGDRLP